MLAFLAKWSSMLVTLSLCAIIFFYSGEERVFGDQLILSIMFHVLSFAYQVILVGISVKIMTSPGCGIAAWLLIAVWLCAYMCVAVESNCVSCFCVLPVFCTSSYQHRIFM